MKILMVASECVPFVKVGGLADVVGTLPKWLRSKRNDVRIIVPKYRKIDEAKYPLKTLACRLLIPVGNSYEEAVIKEGSIGGDIPVYFIDNKRYFDRPEVYRTPDGDYPDNRERFIFFCRAVLEAVKALGFQPDIIHCHDWQTGIIPAYLKTVYRYDGFYCNTATVYTIHNIAYQGMFDADTVRLAGFSLSDFTWDRLEYYGRFNFMKAGLVYADALSTVSPTYARQIQLTDEGRGMEGILRSRAKDMYGILNGIDYTEWNPATDTDIPVNFTAENPKGKAQCKAELQKECGLEQLPDTFLIGAVSRLDPQKGYDLVAAVIPTLMELDVQMVVLGSGDRDLQELLKNLATKYPGRLSVSSAFNNPLAHRIYAGSDAFLMPSRFEPCGLGQMIALAYGTVPIVHRTGGLVDTVADFNTRNPKGNGFMFSVPRATDLRLTIERAYKTFKKKSTWAKIMQNAFMSDFSWKKAVNKYTALYRASLKKCADRPVTTL